MFTNEQTHKETEGKYIESVTATHTQKSNWNFQETILNFGKVAFHINICVYGNYVYTVYQ